MIPNGVYLVGVLLQGTKLSGLCNIGYRPTIGGQHLVIEDPILDFTEDIYGQAMEVKVIGAIRKEKKFKNLEELVGQIKRDKVKAMKMLSVFNKNSAG